MTFLANLTLLAGLTLVVWAVALIYVPAAMLVGGFGLLTASISLSANARRAAASAPGGDA